MTDLQKALMQLQDKEYQVFSSKLMPTVDPKTVIGIRTPELRKLAKQLSNDPDIETFLHTLPHRYYEENNLHGFILEGMKDYQQCVAELEIFLPYIDNWATCDQFTPKVFKKHLPELLEKIREWIGSDRTYTVRYAIKLLMNFYLEEAFAEEYLEMVCNVISGEYYVNMMVAWYFATALAKQYETVLPYIEQRRLGAWTHNKAIQKAIESRRITEEQKNYLRTLKVKTVK